MCEGTSASIPWGQKDFPACGTAVGSTACAPLQHWGLYQALCLWDTDTALHGPGVCGAVLEVRDGEDTFEPISLRRAPPWCTPWLGLRKAHKWVPWRHPVPRTLPKAEVTALGLCLSPPSPWIRIAGYGIDPLCPQGPALPFPALCSVSLCSFPPRQGEDGRPGLEGDRGPAVNTFLLPLPCSLTRGWDWLPLASDSPSLFPLGASRKPRGAR